jgi:hypothetical protein
MLLGGGLFRKKIHKTSKIKTQIENSKVLLKAKNQ